MPAKNKKTTGGVNISGRQVRIDGDVVGRDKIVSNSVAHSEVTEITQRFIQNIESRPDDPNVDKQELVEIVQKIHAELDKGERANPEKVYRWIKFLGSMAEDIFDVVVTTLANPIAGISKSIQLIAKKAKEEAGK